MLSLIVLTHNRRGLLAKCLDSLLRQDFPPDQYEIVVADDGSTDGTGEYVRALAEKRPQVRYAWQPNRGIGAARNLGLEAARGGVVAFLADDYELDPDYASTIMRLLAEHPEAMVVRFKVVAATRDLSGRVGGEYYSLGVIKRLAGAGAQGGFRQRVLALARFREHATTEHALEPAGGAAFRREVFALAGAFDEKMERSEDVDLGERLRRGGIPIYYYPEHKIRHHYESFPAEALRKAYRTGVNRFHFHQKHRFRKAGMARSFLSLAADELATTAGLLAYLHSTGQLAELILFTPFLLMLELANKAGFAAEMLRSLRRKI